MNKARHIFFPLALACLMLLKVSAFHIYTHHNENDDHVECQLCDLAMENQSAELLLDTPVDIAVQHIFFESDSRVLKKQSSFFDTKEHLYLFLRPPPSV